jgi:hypothetical protein
MTHYGTAGFGASALLPATVARRHQPGKEDKTPDIQAKL